MENKKDYIKKSLFADEVKQPSEAGMMCTINSDIFYSFTRNTWIRDSGASFHINNSDTSINDVIDINKLIQGSSDVMPATKKGKLCINVCQVDGPELVHTLWPLKYCPKAGANLLSLRCKLSQENKISSNHQNNIVVNTTYGNIILDRQVKTCDGWIITVNFL